MNLKLKLLRRIVSLILAVLLFINPLATSVIYAEGEEGVTPTEAPAAIIDTGDASASTQNEITANTNENTVAGLLTEGTGSCTPPEGQTTCQNDILISNDNSAGIGDSATSLAITGENVSSGAGGNAVITTGDATASGTMENTINLNSVNLEPTATPSSQISTPEQKSLTVENNNSAEVKIEGQAVATAGGNIASENLGNVQISTGDALAWMNVLNMINLNLVGSNFDLMVLNLIASGNGDINLNELWKQIQEKQTNDSLFLSGDTNASNLTITVSNNNKCSLENNITVSAESGSNTADGNNSAEVNTGDAAALANVNNFVNINVVGSKFLFTIINFFANQNGNLILPRPEKFLNQDSSSGIGGFAFENNNTAKITDSVQVLADSGSNLEKNNGGENSINTGNANSAANSMTIANLNAWLNNWFYFQINNLNNWQGKVSGWTFPNAVENSQNGTQDFQVGSNSSLTPTPAFSFQNNNEIELINNLRTTASTGNNSINNNANGSQINTGNARSAANLFNLVNANILGSNWFFGMVNILGNWTGNTIFAYPDLTVSLNESAQEIKVGETMNLDLSYENKGYDEAENAFVFLDLPPGISYLSDNSGFLVNTNGSNYSWSIGNLKPKQKGNFTIFLKINSDFNFDDLQSFWSKIVKNAYAAENAKEKKISLIASIGTKDPESDFSNNSTSIDTLVYQPFSEEFGSEDQRQAKLEVSATNNVNGFVYPGDTVSFVVLIKNTSDVPSKNTTLTQKLYNGGPEDFGTFNFNIGVIDPGKTAKLSFGLKLPDNGTLPSDNYRTIAQAFGKSPNGNDISSNEARTDFEIRTKQVAAFFEVQAIEKEEEDVLASVSECPPPKKENILPYVLLFALSSLWIVEKSRKLSNKFLINK